MSWACKPKYIIFSHSKSSFWMKYISPDQISSVSTHNVPLTWCFLGSGDISCGMNLIGPLICLLDLFVPSGSVSMAISASSLLAWSHSEHCLRRRNKAPLNELHCFHYHRPTCLVLTVKTSVSLRQGCMKKWKSIYQYVWLLSDKELFL